MNALAIRGCIQESPEGYLIIPATKADKTNLSIFVNGAERKYVTIDFKTNSGTKSYSQLKTAWALISALFVSMYGRKPTTKEREQLHDELLDEYSEKKPSLLHQGEFVPVTFREMTKDQLSRFIQTLINLLFDTINDGLMSDREMLDLHDVFTEWENYISSLEVDPTDLDENGEWLTLEQYRETHPVSYASGRMTDDGGGALEIAHIVSKGSDPAFRDCCWNVMMLTHEEHLGIMHGHETREGGWNALIKRYPHIRGRVDRAFRMAHKLYKVLEMNDD